MRTASVLLLGLVALAAAPASQAQDNARFMRQCAAWLDQHGYSVDYIEQRTGQRPTGNMVQNWIANLDPQDAGPGDVVFIGVESPSGRSQRAEVVDRVLRNDDGTLRGFRTSSMNIGKLVEPACHVTDNFGKVTRRTVAVEQVVRAWRPDSRK